ncbi:Tol-Pal system protein TolB [Sulfurimonas sp. HSL-3221]|uniref:Tol-Pal system protein TolB n=1 Tax=Sulfurimonadaceae TaxID=2771471 RepID=UPI001E50D5DB|nr:Tol-Pal system protein TolB [Sulfurimonas sp. HSL-3221]UFS63326.1 Tol-Pal system protein TolB [Sulfurimonas sp. HSL-3221]
MRFFIAMMMSVTLMFAADATIEVVKEADSLPSIAVEDASVDFTGTPAKRFFRLLSSDLNVLTLFNVDHHYATTHFDNASILNRAMDYTLRFRLRDDDAAFVADIRLFQDDKVVMQKSYRVANTGMSPFVAHAIAYDINDFFGQAPLEWLKRKIIFARLKGRMESEIVIADYTLSYQHVMIKGGLNVFPKWADEAHSAFYYTSLSGNKPTLFKIDVRTGARNAILSSDGMLVCSDVRRNGRDLLLTMAPNGQPDIYLYDTVTKTAKRVTTYGGIDVNGQFMNDGRVVFISNRLGYPNVFAKRPGEAKIEQLVFYGKDNSACSAHNEYVVYKSRETNDAFGPNTFNLHLISMKTDFIRRLTATGINEFPRFSDDGDAIIYIKNYKQQSAIGVIRLAQNKNFLFPLASGKIQSLDW